MTTNYERSAELLLDAYRKPQGPEGKRRDIAAADSHAMLALVDELRRIGPWIKEIGDQLDVAPRAIVRQPFTHEQMVEAFRKIGHEAGHSRDTKTRTRLTEALAVLAPLMDMRAEMASTGTIPGSEPT